MRQQAGAAGGARPDERTDHLIVCNGYKDEEFMRLALMGQKLGHQVFIVLEQLSELDVLLRGRRRAGRAARPPACASSSPPKDRAAGPRAAARSPSSGSTPVELMKLLDRLSALGRKDMLKLIHFHLGSQITDIRYIKAGLEEVGRYYVELREHGRRHHPRGRRRRTRASTTTAPAPPGRPA